MSPRATAARLACGVLLAAGASWAQDPPRAPWMLPQEAPPARTSGAARAAFELVGAVAGVAAGAGVALTAPCLVSPPQCVFGRDARFESLAGIAGALWLFALPAGVTVAGNLGGGRGGYGASLLGTSVGVGAAVPLAAWLGSKRGGGPAAAVAIAVVLPVLGAILGYELSWSDDAPRRGRARARLLPDVSVGPGGGSVGATLLF